MTIERDANGHPVIKMGQELTCAETGKKFIAAPDGCSVNYAWGPNDCIISDEGVDILEKRTMHDQSKPFFCYVSSDGKTVGGWKGNTLGKISNYRESRSGWHGGTIARFRVQDVHGQWWQGRGAGKSMCCILRKMNAPKGF